MNYEARGSALRHFLDLPHFFGDLQVRIDVFCWRHISLSGIFFAQGERLGGTGRHAKSAAQAALEVNSGLVLLHGDGLNLAPFQTGFAACTEVLIHLGEEI